MGVLRNIISSIATILDELEYQQASTNFTTSAIAASVAHKSYTFGKLRITPTYLSDYRVDYGAGHTLLPLLILWKIHGDHNQTATFAEGYLDALDEIERIESALITNINEFGEGSIAIAGVSIESSNQQGNQHHLILTLNIQIEATRKLN